MQSSGENFVHLMKICYVNGWSFCLLFYDEYLMVHIMKWSLHVTEAFRNYLDATAHWATKPHVGSETRAFFFHVKASDIKCISKCRSILKFSILEVKLSGNRTSHPYSHSYWLTWEREVDRHSTENKRKKTHLKKAKGKKENGKKKENGIKRKRERGREVGYFGRQLILTFSTAAVAPWLVSFVYTRCRWTPRPSTFWPGAVGVAASTINERKYTAFSWRGATLTST